MKISVLMPNYNYGKFISQAIRSVLDQDFLDYEIIISDNNSTDDSVKVIKKFIKNPKIKFFQQDVNLWIVWNYNFLLSKATWDYIYFLPTDDYIAPNTLSFLYNNIVNYKIGFIATDRTLFDNEKQWHNRSFFRETISLNKYNIIRFLLLDDIHFTPWMFLIQNNFKKNLIQFDENLEDDVIIRFFLNEHKWIYMSKKNLYFMRVHWNNYWWKYNFEFLSNQIHNMLERKTKYLQSYLWKNNSLYFQTIVKKYYLKQLVNFNFYLVFLKFLKGDFKTWLQFLSVLKQYNTFYTFIQTLLQIPYKILYLFYNRYFKKNLI